MIVRDAIRYVDKPDERGLDLRPFGVAFVPYLGWSRFRQTRRGTVYHVHPGCVEICLCLRGRLLFESLGEWFQFLPGSVFVSGPDQPHRMKSYPKGLTMLSMLLQLPRKNARLAGLSREESERLVKVLCQPPARVFRATDRLRKSFARLFGLFDACDSRNPLDCLAMKTAVFEFLLSVAEASRFKPQKEQSVFTDIARRMREHPEADYPICTLAKEVALSKYVFSEAFKRATGLPPHAWLVDCRVSAAKRLLSNTALTVEDIARSTGFCSSQHFANAFKLSTGATPLVYRRHCENVRLKRTSPR